MHLLHIVPLGLNGGAAQAEKYLSYNQSFFKYKDKTTYTLLFIIPKNSNFQLHKRMNDFTNIHILESSYTSTACSMKRIIDNSLPALSSFISQHYFSHIIFRLELIDKVLLNFIKRHKPILEVPSYPLEENTPGKPLYTLLAKKYMKKALEFSPGTIVTISYFFDFYPTYKHKFHLMPNSLLPEKYNFRYFLPFDGKVLNLMLLTTNFSLGHYSAYERLLVGINGWTKKDSSLVCTLYIFGDTNNNLQKMIHTLNLNNLGKQLIIISPGYLPLSKINNYIKHIHLGINDLGVFRNHSSNIADTIKTIDFIGWGLPFILSHNDENLKESQAFYKTFPPNNSPIDFNELINFVKEITPSIIEEEKKHQTFVNMDHRINTLIKYLSSIKSGRCQLK